MTNKIILMALLFIVPLTLVTTISTAQVAKSIDNSQALQTIQTIRGNITQVLPQAIKHQERFISITDMATQQLNNGNPGIVKISNKFFSAYNNHMTQLFKEQRDNIEKILLGDQPRNISTAQVAKSEIPQAINNNSTSALEIIHKTSTFVYRNANVVKACSELDPYYDFNPALAQSVSNYVNAWNNHMTQLFKEQRDNIEKILLGD